MTDVVSAILRTCQDLDEYTGEYITKVLEDPEFSENEQREVLTGLLETFLEGGDVVRCVDELLAARDALILGERRLEGGDGGGEVGAAAAPGEVDCGRTDDKENEGGNSASGSSSSDSGGSGGSRREPEPQITKDIAVLQSMFPHLSIAYLRRIQVSNNADLEAAVHDLLSKSEEDIQEEMAKMRVAEEERSKSRRAMDVGGGLDESAKAAIKQSFLLEAVPGASGKQSRKNSRRNAEYLNAQIAKSKDTQVRFRDGVVASTKGQKFIIENTKEEWNGGSTGKVYTKGKRGKGFVG